MGLQDQTWLRREDLHNPKQIEDGVQTERMKCLLIPVDRMMGLLAWSPMYGPLLLRSSLLERPNRDSGKVSMERVDLKRARIEFKH